MITSILFGVVTLLVGYFTLFLRKPIHKALFYPLFVALCIITWNNTLGIAMPDDINFFHKKGKIVAQQLVENKAIYVWMIPEGENVPVAFKLPWVKNDAKKLHEASETHTSMKIELPSMKEKIEGKLKNLAREEGPKGEGNAPQGAGKVGEGEKGVGKGQSDPTKAIGRSISNPMIYPDMDLNNLPEKTPNN